MPAHEVCGFDTDLFGYPVGRIDLEHKDLTTDWRSDLKKARDDGMRLVYLISPKYEPERHRELELLEASFPGTLVDWKTLYSSPLTAWKVEDLSPKCEATDEIELVKWERTDVPDALRNLSLAAGIYSRFKVDGAIPEAVFEGVYGGWIKNSVNKSMADETFVAISKVTKEEVGLVTVKRKGELVIDIGLLAVSSSHRRKGISRMLLSRAALWAIEKVGHLSGSKLQVVTQGTNITACRAYENFGFSVENTQIVNHVWMPDALGGLLHDAAAAKLDNLGVPFCKQYLTGQELTYIQEIFASELLNSASKYTSLCAMKLKKMLNGGGGIRTNPNSPSRGQSTAHQTVSRDRDIDKDADKQGSSSLLNASCRTDCKEVIVTASGTSALEMAAILCDVGPGDEVIMPSYTFSSTANAFVLRGATPVFVDIRADTLNIDETLIERAVTSSTKVICVVHYGGAPCEMDTIMELAGRHHLLVVEDAAQGFLSTYKGRQLGTLGDFGCLSFHYTKNIICGEGGALLINKSEAHSKRALVLWEKGTNRCDFMSGKIDKYEWVDVGSSNVPSEISCAILWAQLQESESITDRRRRNHRSYIDGIRSTAKKCGVRIPAESPECDSNAHIFYLVLPSCAARDEMQRLLKERDISAFSHYVPLHSAPAGRRYGRVGTGSETMSVTEATSAGLLRLPVWVGLKEHEIDKVINAVNEIMIQICL